MKIILGQILRVIGWKKLLRMAWDIVDDDIKKHVEKSENQWDNETYKVIDGLIKDLTA